MPAIVIQCDHHGCTAELTVQTKFGGQARAVARTAGWSVPDTEGERLASYSEPDFCPLHNPARADPPSVYRGQATDVPYFEKSPQ